MKMKLLFVLVAFVSFVTQLAFAQERSVAGRVVDTEGRRLPAHLWQRFGGQMEVIRSLTALYSTYGIKNSSMSFGVGLAKWNRIIQLKPKTMGRLQFRCAQEIALCLH
jgi:hypothetical protein